MPKVHKDRAEARKQRREWLNNIQKKNVVTNRIDVSKIQELASSSSEQDSDSSVSEDDLALLHVQTFTTAFATRHCLFRNNSPRSESSLSSITQSVEEEIKASPLESGSEIAISTPNFLERETTSPLGLLLWEDTSEEITTNSPRP